MPEKLLIDILRPGREDGVFAPVRDQELPRGAECQTRGLGQAGRERPQDDPLAVRSADHGGQTILRIARLPSSATKRLPALSAVMATEH
jgi:hypothetical protein